MNLSAGRLGETFRWTKLPKYIRDDELRLRPLRISDTHFLKTGLMAEGMLNAGGLGKPLRLSGLMVWWLLKRASTCCYCVLVRTRRIGVMSLQNLLMGKSAELSLAILDPKLRRCGYGTRAFCLLADSLTKGAVVEELWVQVHTANGAALQFWKKLGFVTVREIDSIRMMSKSLVRRDQ